MEGISEVTLKTIFFPLQNVCLYSEYLGCIHHIDFLMAFCLHSQNIDPVFVVSVNISSSFKTFCFPEASLNLQSSTERKPKPIKTIKYIWIHSYHIVAFNRQSIVVKETGNKCKRQIQHRQQVESEQQQDRDSNQRVMKIVHIFIFLVKLNYNFRFAIIWFKELVFCVYSRNVIRMQIVNCN